MRVYADGSALVRYLPGAQHAADWQRWVAARERDLVVSSLSLSELRVTAARGPLAVRSLARDVADRLEVVRYFDQAVRNASWSMAVLSPFEALHLGVATAHPDVDTLATYDRRLAQVAVIHQLHVVSPGLPDAWWQQDG